MLRRSQKIIIYDCGGGQHNSEHISVFIFSRKEREEQEDSLGKFENMK